MSVCLLVTFMNPPKTAKLFEIAVWDGGSWGPGNHLLMRFQIPTGKGIV